MKPEQLEIERLRREVHKLKAERDNLKMAAAYEVSLLSRSTVGSARRGGCEALGAASSAASKSTTVTFRLRLRKSLTLTRLASTAAKLKLRGKKHAHIAHGTFP